jgi:LuxR family maltose regulon positive regulatory protein
MDVNGQAIELRLRCAHARLRCDRLDDAADAARPALQRMRDEDERGHALMCGVAVLAALAEAPWEARLAAELRVESTAVAPADRAKQPSAPAASADSRDDGLLSSREREVLERIAAGDSNKLIARALDISPHTVKRHVANILDKLGLESRGQASAWLREHA